MVQRLVGWGAEVDAEPASVWGLTALQAAVKGGFYAIAEFLIDQGADPNEPRGRIHGRTALEVAAEYGRLDVMRLLIRHGAGMVMTERGNQFDIAIAGALIGGQISAAELALELKAKAEQARSEVMSENATATHVRGHFFFKLRRLPSRCLIPC